MSPHSNSKQGFTLIELMVTISIIGLLATIVLASLSNARARARDAVRISDLRNMQKALEIYYSNNERYPDISGAVSGWDIGSKGNKGDPFIQELVDDGEFTEVPREQTLHVNESPNYGYTYIYKRVDPGPSCSNGRPFAILAVLFERPHAELGFPNDEIDACGCDPVYAGDTCAHANRYGIMFTEY